MRLEPIYAIGGVPVCEMAICRSIDSAACIYTVNLRSMEVSCNESKVGRRLGNGLLAPQSAK